LFDFILVVVCSGIGGVSGGEGNKNLIREFFLKSGA